MVTGFSAYKNLYISNLCSVCMHARPHVRVRAWCIQN